MEPSSQSTKMRLLQLIQHSQATQPNTPISLSKMAQAVGVSRERARQLYHKLAADYQLPPVGKTGGWSENRKVEHKSKFRAVAEEVRVLREKGVHYKQIPSELGVSLKKVSRTITWLKRQEATSRRLTGPQTLALEKRVRAYRAKGLSATEIAIKTGRSRKTIQLVLHRLDIPLSKRSRKQRDSQGTWPTNASAKETGRMLRYQNQKAKANRIVNLTGLTVDEFEQLVPPFEATFIQRMAGWTMEGTPRVARSYSRYTNCPLPTPEDRLLFMLSYLKIASRQVAHGAMFGLSQTNTSRWIHVLLPVLHQTLAGLPPHLQTLEQRLADLIATLPDEPASAL